MSEGDTSAGSEETRYKRFWHLVRYAFVLGLVGVVTSLVFLGITGIGEVWYGDAGYGWFEGHWWWVAVATVAGLLVGILRGVLKVPEETPSLVTDLESQHVEASHVPSIVAVSAVSLIGGASLGPEVALGEVGGGAASWFARRQKFNEEDTKTLTLTGIAGTFGGLFSSPLLTMSLILEIARPTRERFNGVFYGTLISSSVSFSLYFLVAGTVFLGVFEVPSFEFEHWHLLVGVALGVVSAILAIVVVRTASAMRKVFERLPVPARLKPAIGGLIFGLLGVALPLSNFTGVTQLDTVLNSAAAIGVWLLVATLIAKVIAFAASSASGFIGGPIFPVLFVGGTAGVIVNSIFPDVPIGLAFTCMLAAVPGSLVAAPFTMVLLAALVTQIGAVQTAPVLVAVGAAFLVIEAVKDIAATRAERATTAEEPT